MTDSTRPVASRVVTSLIEEAHDARVAAPIRAALSQLKPRIQKPSRHAAQSECRLPPMDDIIRQTEKTRRALQEAIESAKEVIGQTLDLIERTKAIRDQTNPDSSANVHSAEPIKRISRKAGY